MLSNEGIISFVVATAAISAGARVKLKSGSATEVETAGIADVEIGTAILYSGKSSYAVGEAVGVKLLNAPGTRSVIALSSWAAGATLKRAASGKVDDAGLGTVFAIALEAATADGDVVEALAIPGVTVAAA